MQGPGPAPTRSTRTGRLLQAPLPAPAPAPFAEKSRGSSATLSALGETRVSPPELAAGYGKDNVPLGPFVSAFELPPSSRGSPGGPLPACHSPLSSPAAMFFAAKSGPLAPSSCALGGGGGQGFCCPEPWTSQPGDGGHQVPCLEPLLPRAVFPGGRVSTRVSSCPPRPDCCSPG